MNFIQECMSSRRAQGSLATALLIAVCLTGGIWWWNARWRPPPSIFDCPVDNVLSYLTRDDFNALPLKDRIEYMMQFADRFRGLKAGESASMAAFLAGVTGPTRKQMTQNMRILAKDVLAEGASTYLTLDEKDRKTYIDKWTCDWIRFAERAATGNESKKTDTEILKGIEKQASRDTNRVKELGEIPGLDSDGAMAFLGFFHTQVEGTASPREQGQIARFLDDVRGHYSPVF
ncbi:MAG: hypothetical protein O2800_05610 [Planctomycetota bacterium]|nr:hypothetical protein [Planctomycetota bacterium]